MDSLGRPSVKPTNTFVTQNQHTPTQKRLCLMYNDDEVTVPLSSKTTFMTLPCDTGRALKHFLTTGRKWVSWSELQDVWVGDPEAAVKYLEGLGASFERMFKDMATSNWELHLDAPHYKYLGLRIDATLQDGNSSSMEHSHESAKEVANV